MPPPLSRSFTAGDFPELEVLQELLQRAGSHLRSDIICEVNAQGAQLPVHCI